MTTTTFATCRGTTPAGARVAAAYAARRRDAVAVPSMIPFMVPSMPSAQHAWQVIGADAANGALGTTTKCPARPLGPSTT